MARKSKTKKVPTIQKTVDQFAASMVRRVFLQEQTAANENVISETGAALVSHVAATSPAAQVAFQAKNGRTLLVPPESSSWRSPGIKVIAPGKLEVEKHEPATAKVADEVAELLAKGLSAEAQKLIESVATNGAGAQANTAKTATQAGQEQGFAAIEQRVMAGMVDDVWRSAFSIPGLRIMYPRLYNKGPAIEQQTYKSATMGPIRLSKRAKELLVENRDAIQHAVGRGDYNAAGMVVSRSRGKLAQYLCELEQRVNELTAKVG